MELHGGRKPPGEAAKPPRNTLQRSLALQVKELRENLRRPLEPTRVALRQELTLTFPHFQSFLNQYSSNLSMTGMFVRSESLAPSGTLVDFEFRLVDGLRLIRGRAEVVWVRKNTGDPDRPPGMSLRFLRLDAESRRLIRWLVEKHFAEEGSLVDLKDFLRASKRGAGSDLDLRKLYPYAGFAVARAKKPRPGRPLRKRYGFIAAAVLVPLLAGGFLQRSSSGKMISREASPAPAFAPAAQAGQAEDVEDPKLAREELFETVEALIRERSGGHFDESPSFRRLWETSFQGPEPRGAKLETSLEAEFLSAVRARVIFRHRSLSESAQETVQTTLDLALEDGRWRILEGVTQQRATAADLGDSSTPDDFVQQAGKIEVLKPLNLRLGRPSASAPRVRMVPPGTVLDYVAWTTQGAAIDGNARWYKDLDGNYFWAGGTAASTPGASASDGSR